MTISNIAVVVPVYNRKETTLNFLRQLEEINNDGVGLQTVIVNDGSTDGTPEAIQQQYPQAIVLHGDGNLWWTGAVRMGTEFALQQGYSTILIMNDDLELDSSFLMELLKVARANPDALVSSIKLNGKDDGQRQIITAGFRTTGFFQEIAPMYADEPYQDDMPEVLECDVLTGSSLLIPAQVFSRIGMFDNRCYPHGFGDFEFTLRASLAGYKCLCATKSRIFTEHNQNYTDRYLVRSTRIDFLRNLFNKTKFGYGFASLRQVCFMHKPFWLGVILYSRSFLGLTRKILMKIFFPNQVLRNFIRAKNLSDS